MAQSALVAALLVTVVHSTTSVTSGRMQPALLELRITRIEVHSIEMTWQLEGPRRHQLNVSACRLVYSTSGGPQLLVLTGLRSDRPTFSLYLPDGDWAYHVQLVCRVAATEVASNQVKFRFEPSAAGAPTLLPYRSHQTERSPSAEPAGQRRSPAVHVQPASSGILLGISCGLVGLVVINTTLVLLLRHYSRHRQRRRRQELFKTFGPAAFEDEELVYHITA